jgi:hypothetical protein
MEFLVGAPDSTINEVLDSHDIGFLRQAQLTDCNQTFPASDRNTWHAFDGEFYFIEANGRPNRAYKYLRPSLRPRESPAVRRPSDNGATPSSPRMTTTAVT